MEEKFIVSAWYNMVRIFQTSYGEKQKKERNSALYLFLGCLEQHSFVYMFCLFEKLFPAHRETNALCFLIVLSYHCRSFYDNHGVNKKEHFQVLKPEIALCIGRNIYSVIPALQLCWQCSLLSAVLYCPNVQLFLVREHMKSNADNLLQLLL